MAAGGAPNTPPNGPPPSAIQTKPPFISFKQDAVPPSQYLYLQLDDQIKLVLYTNFNNAQITGFYRYLTPQGDIKVGQVPSTLLTANVVNYITITLGECWLLSFTLFTQSSIGNGQWIYANVLVARYPQAIFAALGLIWQGYVRGDIDNGWPGQPSQMPTDGAGRVYAVVGATPGAGADISETMPGGRRRNLLALRATLTTSATVANRIVGITLDDGTNQFHNIHSSLNQTASSVTNYNGTPGQTFFNDTVGSVIVPLPPLTTLKANYRIKTVTTNLQASDQWTAPIYLVQEWLDSDA